MSSIQIDERGREQVPAWYGIAITTNKEKLIRSRIQALAQTEQWKDQIFDCILPSFIEVNDKGKEVEKLAYTQTGYVHMILNSDTWNALELLRGIGFRAILPAGNAQPIPKHEMESIFRMTGYDNKEKEVPPAFAKGDRVQIADPHNPFNGQIGTISEWIETEEEVLLLLGDTPDNQNSIHIHKTKLLALPNE